MAYVHFTFDEVGEPVWQHWVPADHISTDAEVTVETDASKYEELARLQRAWVEAGNAYYAAMWALIPEAEEENDVRV